MRDAETTLAVIRERGKKGLHLEDVYRQLYNPDLFLRAYGRIYKNTGAMTRGTTEETVDGMSTGKIQSIIDSLRGERYRWSPVRCTFIPKRKRKDRDRSASRSVVHTAPLRKGVGDSGGPEPGPPSVLDRSGPGSPGPMTPDRPVQFGDDLGRQPDPPGAAGPPHYELLKSQGVRASSPLNFA